MGRKIQWRLLEKIVQITKSIYLPDSSLSLWLMKASSSLLRWKSCAYSASVKIFQWSYDDVILKYRVRSKMRKKSNKPSFHLYHPGFLLVLRAWTSQIWKTRFNQHQSNQESKASEKNPISYFLIEKWDAVRRRPLTVFSVACHVLLFHIFVWLCLWDKLIECRSQNMEKF